MTPRERTMGKLISLQRAREEAEREALARAADEVALAAAAERSAEDAARAVRGALAQAEGAPVPEGPLAEVLLFRSRFARAMRGAALATARRTADLKGERVAVEEAAARARSTWERARRARERSEEQERRYRRDARRAREQREEAEGDDRPCPADDGGRDPRPR